MNNDRKDLPVLIFATFLILIVCSIGFSQVMEYQDAAGQARPVSPAWPFPATPQTRQGVVLATYTLIATSTRFELSTITATTTPPFRLTIQPSLPIRLGNLTNSSSSLQFGEILFATNPRVLWYATNTPNVSLIGDANSASPCTTTFILER